MEIHDTIKLDRCYLCSIDTSLHQHHVIPRAFGGTNGPTVTVCAVCHTTVHNLGWINLSSYPKELINQVVKQENSTLSTDSQVSKAAYLATVIYTSRKAVEGDINKGMVSTTTFNGEDARKLRMLARTLNKSQQEVIRLAISRMYSNFIA